MSKQRILGDLAHNLDSSAVGSFLAKSSAGGDFQTVDYSSITGTPSVVLDSSLTSQLIDSSYIQLRETPSTSGIDSATALNLIDSSYLSNINGTNTGFAEFYYNATAGQTIFDSDLRGRNLSYTEGGVMVFLNGVMLAPAQYTATDGTTVVLDSGASLSDEITVVKFGLGSSGGGGLTYAGDRALFGGGYGSSAAAAINTIQYYDITTPGNASDFGDLDQVLLYLGACSNSTYGVFAGGYWSQGAQNVIQYVTISTTGNTTDFGDLTSTVNKSTGASNGTYGLWFRNKSENNIEYITIASPGNATDFGDVSYTGAHIAGTGSNTTYVLLSGGYSGGYLNEIHYVTAATPGNSTDFGDMTVGKLDHVGTSNATYTLFGGNDAGASNNVIDYVTTATPGNATDFGDLTVGGDHWSAAANTDYATFAGPAVNGSHNVINYVTIATPGNASDFGDLLTGAYGGAACSGAAA